MKNYSDEDLESISDSLLKQCNCVRLLLNTQVTKVSYHEKPTLNKIVYETENNGKKIIKHYDYVIIAFPLTKVSFHYKKSFFFINF